MLICSKQNCTCHYHLLLRCIEKGINDEAESLFQKLENSGDLFEDLGYNSLHHAAKHGNIVMMLYLIESRCNIDAIEYLGFSALILAICQNNAVLVKILLQNKADIYGIDLNGWSSLQLALQCDLYRWSCHLIKASSWPILNLLFEQVNHDYSKDRHTVEWLMLKADNMVKLAAIAYGNVKLAKIILKNGYPIDFCEPNHGYTALHCAIIFARTETANLLIELGADVNVVDRCGNSPLHAYTHNFQATDKNSEVLQLFLKRRTDWEDGQKGRGCKNAAKILLTFGSKETVKTVLEYGIDESTKFDSYESILHLLVSNTNMDTFDIPGEVDFGDVDARNCYGETVLIAAIRRGYVRKVEFLLQRGADVNLKFKHRTPLYYACILGTNNSLVLQKAGARITELLLQYGANAQLVFGSLKTYIDCLSRPYKNKFAIKVIMANLALIDTSDRSDLTGDSLSTIWSYHKWRAYFKSCTEQLEELKNIVVHNKVSLLELLNEKDNKMMTYARNPEFILALSNTIKTASNIDSYYLNTLQLRMDNAKYKIELCQKAALACELLFGLCSDVYHSIIYKIINYLDCKDLHRLSRV